MRGSRGLRAGPLGRLGVALAAGLLALVGAGASACAQPLPDTLFLTWDGPPTSTLTLVWLGDDPAQAEDPLGVGLGGVEVVRFKPDGQEAWSQTGVAAEPFGASGAVVHRAHLTGLPPGRRVAFRFSEDGPEGFARTLPERLTEPLTFAIGGDASASSATERTCRQAAARDAGFAVLGGDLAYANGRTPERWVRFLRIWSAAMVQGDGDRIPIVAGIGNHEVDGGWTRDRARAPFFYALFGGLYPEHGYAAFDVGDYASFVLLDTGHTTSMIGAQKEWLDDALAARAARPHLFAVYHVPAYPSHREPDTKSSPEVRRHWVPLFERHGVDLCFENHDHAYKRTHPLKGGARSDDGIIYLGDGCWGVGPRKVADRPWFAHAESRNHFFAVTLRPDGTREVVAVDDEGAVFDRVP